MSSTNPFLPPVTPESLEGTDGRPRRVNACEACKKRRGKVSAILTFIYGELTLKGTLLLDMRTCQPQCERPGPRREGDCKYCKAKGALCIVSVMFTLGFYVDLFARFHCSRPSRLTVELVATN